jgi:hypothetical protein
MVFNSIVGTSYQQGGDVTPFIAGWNKGWRQIVGKNNQGKWVSGVKWSERKKKNGACVWFCVLCVGKRMKPTTKKKIIPITKKEPWFLKKEMGAYPMRWCASSNMTSSSEVHASLLTLGSK